MIFPARHRRDDDRRVFYIWGDNGSSGEGHNGTISELLAQTWIPTTVRMHVVALEEVGGLDALGSPLDRHTSTTPAGLGR